MNKNIVIVFIFFAVQCEAQKVSCDTLKGVFYYINFEIRKEGRYPIIMNGISFNYIDSFSKKNEKKFIDDFYSNCTYTPDIVDSYEVLAKRCFSHNDTQQVAKVLFADRIKKKILSNSLEKQIILESGETCYLFISKIKATLFILNKEDVVKVTSSFEKDILAIRSIEKSFCISDDIFVYEKNFVTNK